MNVSASSTTFKIYIFLYSGFVLQLLAPNSFSTQDLWANKNGVVKSLLITHSTWNSFKELLRIVEFESNIWLPTYKTWIVYFMTYFKFTNSLSKLRYHESPCPLAKEYTLGVGLGYPLNMLKKELILGDFLLT